MMMHERCFRTLEEAKETQKITGGTISSFLSTDENENIITVYCVRYRQLF